MQARSHVAGCAEAAPVGASSAAKKPIAARNLFIDPSEIRTTLHRRLNDHALLDIMINSELPIASVCSGYEPLKQLART
jgi:hypothetical protein